MDVYKYEGRTFAVELIAVTTLATAPDCSGVTKSCGSARLQSSACGQADVIVSSTCLLVEENDVCAPDLHLGFVDGACKDCKVALTANA